MPNCFRLYPKGSADAAPLARIDEAICERFGWAVHPVRYVEGWFDTIGWGIAVRGHRLGSPELRAHVLNYGTDGDGNIDPKYQDWTAKLILILDYLDAHYTSDAWVEIGRQGVTTPVHSTEVQRG